MRAPLVWSIVLHLSVAVGLTVGAPDFGDPMQAPEAVQVEVVSEEELAKKLGEAQPDQAESEAEPTGRPEEAPEDEAPEQVEEPASDPAQAEPDDSAPAVPESARQPEPEPAPEPEPEPERPEAAPEPEREVAEAPPEPEPEPEPAPEPDPRDEPAPPAPGERPEKPEPAPEQPQAEPEPESEEQAEPDPDRPPEKPRVEMADSAQEDEERTLDSILKDVEQSYSGGSQSGTADAEADEAAETQDRQAAADETSDRVTSSQRQAIRREIEDNWNVPAGARDAEDLVVELRVTFNQDRSVASVEIVNDQRMDNPFFSAAARSAARAVHMASPLESLPPDAYGSWRVMELTFDPKEMLDS